VSKGHGPPTDGVTLQLADEQLAPSRRYGISPEGITTDASYRIASTATSFW